MTTRSGFLRLRQWFISGLRGGSSTFFSIGNTTGYLSKGVRGTVSVVDAEKICTG